MSPYIKPYSVYLPTWEILTTFSFYYIENDHLLIYYSIFKHFRSIDDLGISSVHDSPSSIRVLNMSKVLSESERPRVGPIKLILQCTVGLSQYDNKVVFFCSKEVNGNKVLSVEVWTKSREYSN